MAKIRILKAGKSLVQKRKDGNEFQPLQQSVCRKHIYLTNRKLNRVSILSEVLCKTVELQKHITFRKLFIVTSRLVARVLRMFLRSIFPCFPPRVQGGAVTNKKRRPVHNFKRNLPGSSFHGWLWGSGELLSAGRGVPRERLGVRCKTCDARSAKRERDNALCQPWEDATAFEYHIEPTFSMSSQFVTMPCSMGYFRVRIPRLL